MGTSNEQEFKMSGPSSKSVPDVNISLGSRSHDSEDGDDGSEDGITHTDGTTDKRTPGECIQAVLCLKNIVNKINKSTYFMNASKLLYILNCASLYVAC